MSIAVDPQFGRRMNPALIWSFLQGEDPDPDSPPTTLPATDEERTQFMIFSPFYMQKENLTEMLIVALVLLKVAKQPKGLETLKELGIQYMKTCGKVLAALEDASTTNWLNCWINQKLSLRVLKRLGLVTVEDYVSLESSYNSMFSVVIAKDAIVDTITALGSFTKGLGGLLTGGAALKGA